MKKFVHFILCAALLTAMVTSCSDKEEAAAVNVESIVMKNAANDSLQLLKGDTYRLQVETVPPNGLVRFYASSSDAFRIHQRTGEITALLGGAGTVIAVAPNGDSWTKAYCHVFVKELVETITLNPDQKIQILAEGDTKDVKSFFTVYPLTATHKKCAYKSSDPSAVAIDPETGIATVVDGTKKLVEITAVSTDGSNVVSEPALFYVGYTSKTFSHGEGETAWVATKNGMSFPGAGPAAAIDNNLDTYCFWTEEHPNFLQIDFKIALTLHEVLIHRSYLLNFARDVEIYFIPDDVTTEAGITWTDERYVLWGSVTFGNEPVSVTTKILRTFPHSITTRYLMLKFLNGNGGNLQVLAEVIPGYID